MAASGQSLRTVLAISGSLRAESFNTALLHALTPLAPDGLAIDVYKELGDIPHFNQDLEQAAPPVVQRLRAAIREADALLISTPEFNRGIPGALKDAIDWAARPLADRALEGKVIAVLSASPGPQGGIRAQVELRRILSSLNNLVLAAPEVAISEVHTRLGASADAERALTDEGTAKLLRAVLDGVAAAIDADAGRAFLAGAKALTA